MQRYIEPAVISNQKAPLIYLNIPNIIQSYRGRLPFLVLPFPSEPFPSLPVPFFPFLVLPLSIQPQLFYEFLLLRFCECRLPCFYECPLSCLEVSATIICREIETFKFALQRTSLRRNLADLRVVQYRGPFSMSRSGSTSRALVQDSSTHRSEDFE